MQSNYTPIPENTSNLRGQPSHFADVDMDDVVDGAEDGGADRQTDFDEDLDWSDEYNDISGISMEDPSDEVEWNQAEEDVTSDFSSRRPPAEDSLGSKFVTIVDSSGVHHLPVLYCNCPGAHPQDEQAFGSKLFPASFTNISTLFTFSVLDHFRLENLECKTTPYQFYQKLRRLTNSSFPQSVPNRYAELRRLSRQWRQLQKRKWYGMAYDPTPRGNGQMAIFCAACPQPGVNLKPAWIEDKDK